MSEWSKSTNTEGLPRTERNRIKGVQAVISHINAEKVRHVEQPRKVVSDMAAFKALKETVEVRAVDEPFTGEVPPVETPELTERMFNPVLDHERGHYLSIALRSWDVT